MSAFTGSPSARLACAAVFAAAAIAAHAQSESVARSAVSRLSQSQQLQLASQINNLFVQRNLSFCTPRELVKTIQNELALPAVSPYQIAAGRTVLTALNNRDSLNSIVADLKKIGGPGSPSARAAEALSSYFDLHLDNRDLVSATSEELARLKVEQGSPFDGLSLKTDLSKTQPIPVIGSMSTPAALPLSGSKPPARRTEPKEPRLRPPINPYWLMTAHGFLKRRLSSCWENARRIRRPAPGRRTERSA